MRAVNAEIIAARVQNSTFSYTPLFYSLNSGLQNNMILVETKTPSRPVMCPFPLFVALRYHNLPTLQTDR